MSIVLSEEGDIITMSHLTKRYPGGSGFNRSTLFLFFRHMSENTNTVIAVFVISLERVGLSGEKVGGAGKSDGKHEGVNGNR
jgi:hypothetical protein